MGDPLSIIGLALTAVSTIGSLTQANAQADVSESNAAVAEQNALYAEEQGATAVAEAAETEKRIRQDNARRMGSAAAARGASGVALEGSPLDVFADATAEGELTALDARYQGLVQSRYYNRQAELDRQSGQSELRQADQARSMGLWGAAGTLIGGGTSYGRSLIGGGGRTLGSGYQPERITGRRAGPV